MKKTTTKLRLHALFLCLGLLAFGKLGFASPQYRKDLEDRLAKLLCEVKNAPDLATLWKHEVYDLHLQTHLISAEKVHHISDGKLKKIARKFAVQRGMQSYASHVCRQRPGQTPSNKAWIIVAPGRGIVEKKGPLINLNMRILTENCRHFRVDYAPGKLGTTKPLFLQKKMLHNRYMILNSHFLKPGTIGITCYPNTSSQSAPIEWAIIPTDKPHVLSSSFASIMTELKSTGSMKKWVNQIRTQLNLASLNFSDPKMRSQAKTLTFKNTTAYHDRSALKQMKNQLAKANYQLNGENRAVGRTLSDIAWLFWHSPRHRSLLLSPHSNRASLEIVERSHHLLAVLILARKTKYAEIKPKPSQL